MNDDDNEQYLTNRDRSLTAKKGLHWCDYCDMEMVGKLGRCPTCGKKNSKRKIKK